MVPPRNGRSLWSGILAGTALLVSQGLTGEMRAQPAPSGRGGIANFDIRVDKPEPTSDARVRYRRGLGEGRRHFIEERGQARGLARERLAGRVRGLKLKDSPELGTPEIVGVSRGRGPLTAASDEPRGQALKRFLAENADLYGLTAGQVAELQETADDVAPAGELAWVTLEQKLHGRPVFRGELRAAFTPAGELVQTVGQLAPDVKEPDVAVSPSVSAAAAVEAAAAAIGLEVSASDLRVTETEAGGDVVVFEGGPFVRDTKAELVYFPLEPGLASLAWSTVLWLEHSAYYVIVDAEGGELLFRKDITDDQSQPATYVVYDADSPAPLSPSTALPGTNTQAPLIARTSFTLVSEHAADDLGWIPDGGTTTTGNNVDAGLDLVSPNGSDAGSRPASAGRVFDFPYNPAPGDPAPGESPTLANYRFGEVVNMFFWTNRYHDRLYALGFTEAARNFQQNNFGRGGIGNDRVLAEGQDFSGTSNANFATPPDGSSGRMQMFIFDEPTPDRTSGLDQEIVIHELTHGTSNRLHANASGLTATMSRGMGEGWSDFFARALLSSADEDVNGIYAMGGYSTLAIVPGFTDNYYYGIRRFPYAVKTTLGANGRPHNPLTFADLDPTQINLTDGAHARGPIGSSTAFQVHNVGEIWCMALLEVRARLIQRLGWAAGNQRMLQLVVDGMKLDPANPTLLDGRNSILAASAASGGGPEEERDIWAGFATRGMGFSATAVGPTSSSVHEAFDLPNLQLGPVTIVNDSYDHGGFADPGETVTLDIPLVNPLAADALGTTANLVGAGTQGYGDIAGGATVARQFEYTVPADAVCGSQLTLSLEVDSSLGPVTHTFTLQVGAPTGVVPHEYSSGPLATPIPDLSTVEIPIAVADTGAVGSVQVRVRLNHTFTGDLVLSLIAPDGATVTLASRRGGGGDNYGAGANDCSGTFTVFDDGAATAIASGTAPFAGSFRPDSPLAALRGKPMAGTWRLRIVDAAGLDVGTVGCVQIRINQQLFYCVGVPGFPLVVAEPPATLTAESAEPPNGAPDPDETVTVSFPLRNVGTAFSNDLVATLIPGGGVNAPSGPQSYGAMSPVGGPVAREFTFVAGGDCGGTITATLHLQDGALDLGHVTFSLQIGTTLVTPEPPVSNPASINFPVDTPAPGDGVGPATPYPSAISVSGLTGTVSKVTVTLSNMSHTFPGDIDVLLVGPQGQRMILMSDAGGATDINDVTLTFDDAAPTALPSTIVSGTYRPTNVGTGDSFPAPAPPGPHGATLSVFNGSDPNGAWSLYVFDDAAVDSGSFAGGWTLNITTARPVCVTSPCTLVVSDLTVGNDPGQCGALVAYPPPVVRGSCGVVTTDPPSGSFFPVGATTVTATGTRQDGSTTNATFVVRVEDREAPSLGALSASPSSLWPPDHHLVPVDVSYASADNCGVAAEACVVSSNEPSDGLGDGDFAPDWIVDSPHRVRLRAERSGNGTGRFYTITCTATDAEGNHTSGSTVVTVPHDQS